MSSDSLSSHGWEFGIPFDPILPASFDLFSVLPWVFPIEPGATMSSSWASVVDTIVLSFRVPKDTNGVFLSISGGDEGFRKPSVGTAILFSLSSIRPFARFLPVPLEEKHYSSPSRYLAGICLGR